MATVTQIINDVDARLPNNGFTEAQKLAWLNDTQRKVAKYLDVELVYEFLASSSMEYALSTSIRVENIKRVLVGDSTAIANISSTTVWGTYKYAGENDILTGNQYYVPNFEHYNTTSFSVGLGLYPESTEIRVARLYYKTLLPELTTASSSNSPLWNSEWHDILKFGLMEIIAKSGNNPDVELANNYHADYVEMLREIKKDTARKIYNRPRARWNYQEHTWG